MEFVGIHGGEGDWCRNKKSEEDKQREQKYVRGGKFPVRKEKNVTLKNRIRYQEKLIKEAVEGTAKLEKWLLPGGAGYIEAEGKCLYLYCKQRSRCLMLDWFGIRNAALDMLLVDSVQDNFQLVDGISVEFFLQ